MGRTAEAKLGLGVVLTGTFSGISEAQGKQIMEAAHNVCPYRFLLFCFGC